MIHQFARLRPYQRWHRITVLFFSGLALCLGLQLLPGILPGGVAQSPSPGQLVNQGIELYQKGQFADAAQQWEAALKQSLSTADRATIHSNLAQVYRKLGKLDLAIAQWDQAIQIYRTLPEKDLADGNTRLVQAQIEQAQVYSDLGQHPRSIDLLQPVLETVRKSGNSTLEVAALGSIGNAYWSLGEYDQAIKAHQSSLTIARQLQNPPYLSTALINLGNVYASRADRNRDRSEAARLEEDLAEQKRFAQAAANDTQAAMDAYGEGVTVSRTQGGMAEARALLNFNRLLVRLVELKVAPPNAIEEIARQRTRILTLVQGEPDSQDKAFLLIGLANGLIREGEQFRGDVMQANPLLDQALQVTRSINDKRGESFALGSLGRVYEVRGDYDTALKFTRQAQFTAQQVSAGDSLYRWYWQLGRIFRATGDIPGAITAYEQSIATLQSIRGDIIVANQDLQFDFRDSVEPVYRQLIGLLLRKTQPTAADLSQSKSQSTAASGRVVRQVLDTLELLKLAELQNFFGDDCVQVAQAIVAQERDSRGGLTKLGDPNSAVIYSVVLSDRTELVLRLADGSVSNYQMPLTDRQLQQTVDSLRALLERRSTDEYLPAAQQLYQMLIAPIEDTLVANQVKTLVFVNDGVLRKVPMAALHDGKQFLVQKFAIGNTPSLSLTTRQPLDRRVLKALIVGLTVEQPPFAALFNVAEEARTVQQIIGGNELIDRAFTPTAVKEELRRERYPIVHMATHGKFGADSESTFLLGYESRITIRELDTLLRSSLGQQQVELLTLSACQTAAGDNRSALGIAGVAVRAGVKTALASLWYINDQATVPLIEEFYKQLRQPGITKAEALQKAQIRLITEDEFRDYNHPAVWAPFILIGNWL